MQKRQHNEIHYRNKSKHEVKQEINNKASSVEKRHITTVMKEHGTALNIAYNK
jgi:hypothetical protein